MWENSFDLIIDISPSPSQIQVPNPKSKVQRKRNGTGADNRIQQLFTSFIYKFLKISLEVQHLVVASAVSFSPICGTACWTCKSGLMLFKYRRPGLARTKAGNKLTFKSINFTLHENSQHRNTDFIVHMFVNSLTTV